MRRPEQALHLAVAQLLEAVLPRSGAIWCHIPNGGARRKRRNANGQAYCPEGAVLKRMGVRPGMPDIQIIAPGPRLVYIELKAKGGRLSEAQREMHRQLEAVGADVRICSTVEQVRDAMSELGLFKPWIAKEIA